MQMVCQLILNLIEHIRFFLKDWWNIFGTDGPPAVDSDLPAAGYPRRNSPDSNLALVRADLLRSNVKLAKVLNRLLPPRYHAQWGTSRAEVPLVRSRFAAPAPGSKVVVMSRLNDHGVVVASQVKGIANSSAYLIQGRIKDPCCSIIPLAARPHTTGIQKRSE
jgi:hypothetical protein